jgi:hypothetical protein
VLGIMHPLRKQRANLNIYMAGYLLVTCFNVGLAFVMSRLVRWKLKHNVW